MAQPFLKWVGGKRQLLPQLERHLPRSMRDGHCPLYVEPFIGGGAMFFHLRERCPVSAVIIGDANKDLALSYAAIKKQPERIASLLQLMAERYAYMDDGGKKAMFYSVRDGYNDQRDGFPYTASAGTTEGAGRVALRLFLNRACFNGLYRTNSKGDFNSPFGYQKVAAIPSLEALKEASIALRKTEIFSGDFGVVTPLVVDGAFVYCDPPYRPLTKTASFASYTAGGFGDAEQKRLAREARKWVDLGADVMISNSDPDDDFFETIYEGFHISRVSARRAVSSKATTRGPVSELVIASYPVA